MKFCLALALVGLATTAFAQTLPKAPDGCAWAGAELMCRNGAGSTMPVTMPLEVAPGAIERANAGDAAALTGLAMFYIDGPTAQHDEARGVDLLKKAAAASYAPALIALGRLHDIGDGSPVDHAESFRWYLLAAAKGDGAGMAMVGDDYIHGNGVVQDYGLARQWLDKAVAAGSSLAPTDLAVLVFNGLGGPKDDRRAAELARLAADRGGYRGMKLLAAFYANGFGVPRDPQQALEWNKAAAALIDKTSVPSEHELMFAYPIDAYAAGVAGQVTFECEVDQQGGLHDCAMVLEGPKGFGFGEAARTLLGRVRYSPKLAGGQVKVPIAFKLGQYYAFKAPVADRCAAYALALTAQGAGLSEEARWWARYWPARAHYLQQTSGQADPADRLAPAVAQAAADLGAGKARGFLGQLSRCMLR